MLRVCWRAGRVAAHLLGGMFTIMALFPRMSPEQQALRVQIWSSQLLACLGVQLQIHGAPPVAGPLLLVANHISWLDIVVLHAAHHCRFVSKSDVGRWPVIGTLATGAGTLYIERRSRRDAMRVVHQMAQALRDGDILAIFPEGTTGDGGALLPFHANLIQAAVSAQAPIQPVALRFDDARGRPSRAVSYIGDESLVGSIWRTLSSGGIRAVVRFGDPQPAGGRERRVWALDLQAEVERLRDPSSAR